MRFTGFLIFLTIVLLPFTALRAQVSNIRFEHISTADGLSHIQVRQIFQDSRGFIWIGTDNGLNKFDGYNFTVYNHDPKNPASISSDVVNCIYEDKNNVLWIGTADGLNRFDRATEIFTSYRPDPAAQNGISWGFIKAILEDHKGNLWVGTAGGGLNLFDRGKNSFKVYAQQEGNPQSLRSNYVQHLMEDKEGTLWIATDNGVCTLTQQDMSKGIFGEIQQPATLPSKYVKSIAQAPDGTIWIATDAGLCHFQPGTPQPLKIYRHDPEKPGTLMNDYTKWVYVNPRGVVWVATDGGICRLRPENRERGWFENFQPDNTHRNSLQGYYIKHIFEDREGILWIGGDGGINQLDNRREVFKVFEYESGKKNTLTNSFIRAIAEDDKGGIWLGTNGGLAYLDPQNRNTSEFIYYRHHPDDPKSLVNNYITALHIDKDGILWIGTDNGLSRRNGDGTFTSFVNNEADKNSLIFNTILAIDEDSQGNLWIGTWRGISRLDRENKSKGIFTNYSKDRYTRSGNGEVYLFYEDLFGVLWIGTGDGMVTFDKKHQTFVSRFANPAIPERFITGGLRAMVETSKDGFWLGSDGNGLYYYDRRSDVFTHYTQKEGLQSNFIYGILTDKENNLWLSSNKGIIKFTPPALTKDGKALFRSFDVEDGVQSTAQSKGAVFQSRTGEMLFGTSSGFTVFYPRDITNKYDQTLVYITDFKLFNKSIRPRANSLLQKHINETKEITLSYKENFFEFEFAALNYRHPQRNVYAYMMEGFDKEWIYKDAKERFATYTNLAPGTYFFKVKASGGDGRWSDPSSVRIVITPPFWQTWWFIGAILFSGSFGAYFWYESRVKKVHWQKQMLEKQVGERTAEIEVQKNLIEKKNLDITASITYAQRIQAAMLPKHEKINSGLPEYFILFKPRDIVSGDFYWMTGHQGKVIIAAIDCTGHGVPGAFMSMIGNGILNQVIFETEVTTANEILNRLHKGVQNALQQTETLNRDGMDAALCVIDRAAGTMQFAGAKNPLIYIKKDEYGKSKLHEIKGDKMPIGGVWDKEEKERLFTCHEIECNTPGMYYLFSDGYQDQFGGPKGKKFMVKAFKELLMTIHAEPVARQKEILENTLAEWMGNESQMDDILVIGFRI